MRLICNTIQCCEGGINLDFIQKRLKLDEKSSNKQIWDWLWDVKLVKKIVDKYENNYIRRHFLTNSGSTWKIKWLLCMLCIK